MVNNKFDARWFKLKNYDVFLTLNLDDWYRQIAIRKWIQFVLFSSEKEFEREFEKDRGAYTWAEEEKQTALFYVSEIKKNPIVGKIDDILEEEIKAFLQDNPFAIQSVDSTPAYFIRFLGTEEKLKDVWKICDSFANDDFITKDQWQMISTSFDQLCRERSNLERTGIIETDSIANIKIDLQATDAKIKEDFDYWLIKYRKVVGYYPKTSEFTVVNAKKWYEFRVMPYIDVVLMAKIEEKKLEHREVAEIIFQDDFKHIDQRDKNIDKVRRTTKEYADALMNDKGLTLKQPKPKNSNIRRIKE